MVLYDPRADWKLKAYVIVIINKISAVNGLLERLYAQAGVKGWLFPPAR